VSEKAKTTEKQFSPQEIFAGYVAVLHANTEALRKHAEAMSKFASVLVDVKDSADAVHDIILEYMNEFGAEEGEEEEEPEDPGKPDKPEPEGNGHDATKT